MGDGSLERVLIGQLVTPGAEEDSGKWTGTPPELTSPSQSVRTMLGSLGSRSRTCWQRTHPSVQPLTYSLSARRKHSLSLRVAFLLLDIFLIELVFSRDELS